MRVLQWYRLSDMLSIRLLSAAFAAGVVSSLTDWLFMGPDWLYRRYDHHPEIWRSFPRGETRAILLSCALSFLTCFFFALTCAWLHLHSFAAPIILAVAIWLVGPLPLIGTNTIFHKLSPVIAASHALGWLAKLIVAACAFTLIAG